MAMLRRHLRLWVAAWIVFQAASLSAFVPRDCCAAHRVPPAEDQQADGSASCHHAGQPARPEADCTLGGTCDGPLGTLAALLSPHAVLTAALAANSGIITTSAPLFSFESPRSLALPPDAPPPRS